MWLDNAAQDMVDLFWRRCGTEEPFPRNLERSVALALPVCIVYLPRLGLRSVESWLQQRGVAYHFNCDTRAVRGCLVAYRGEGLVFIDGADLDDQRRFTIAHEVAHFMVDYWQPRERAIARLGQGVADVIDGLRPPTVAERVNALLTHTPAGVHTDLMERECIRADLWKIEDRADQVALALLAPPQAVLAATDLSAGRFDQRRASLTTVLCDQFGLPVSVAQTYTYALLAAIGKGPSLAEYFRG